MANEIKWNVRGGVTNGNFTDTLPAKTFSLTQNAIGQAGGVVIVGQAAEEDLGVGDVTVLGWLYVENLDSTNYIKYGPKSGGVIIPFGKLKPGEFAWLRLYPGITFRWTADTADCKALVKLFQD